MRRWATFGAVLAVALLGLPGVAAGADLPADGGTLERLVPAEAPGGADADNVIGMGGAFSWNGRYLTYGWGYKPYAAYKPNPYHVVVRDLTDNSERILPAPAPDFWPSAATDDGTYLVFSTATALVAEDTDALSDVYRWNLATDAKTLQSADIPAGQGALAPQITADGNRILFIGDPSPTSQFTTRADRFAYVRDLAAGTTLPLARTAAGDPLPWNTESARISGDGTVVALMSRDQVVGETPGGDRAAIYLQDLSTWQPVRVSSNSQPWEAADPVLDYTGDTVAFGAGSYYIDGDPSKGMGKATVRVFDRLTGTETQLDDSDAGPGGLGQDAEFGYPVLSANGRYVGFTAVRPYATAYYQALIHDRWTGTTVRPAVRADGELPANWHGTTLTDISPDGRRFVFDSDSDDLGSNFRSTSSYTDAFLRTYPAAHGLPDTTLQPVPAATGASPSFTFAAHSRATYECAVDGGWKPCTSPFTAGPLSDGPHEFAVRATDPDGRVEAEPAVANFVVDTVAPALKLSGPTLTRDSTPTFTFAAPGATASTCQVDARAAAPCSSPFTLAALADGPHTLAVRAADAAGNMATARIGVTVDTKAPQTTIATSPSSTTDSTPTLTLRADQAGSTFQCKIDKQAWKACKQRWTTSKLSKGKHALAVRATDPAGNVDPSPATRKITIK